MSIINLNKGDNLSATLQNGRIGAPVDARQSVLYYKDIFDNAKYKYPYAYCQVIVRENDPEDTEHPKGIYVITEVDRLGNVVSSGVIPLSLLIDGKLEDITIATTKIQSSVELGRINSEDSTFRIEAGSGIKVDKWPNDLNPVNNAVQISVDTDVLATKTDLTAKYEKPSGGIPKIHLSSDVQASLNKADTALQNHQDISGKADKADTYTKAQTYSKNEVDAAIAAIDVSEQLEDVAFLGEDNGQAVIPEFDPQTDTLHKKAQVLTASEKAQVQQNIGVYSKDVTYTKTEVNGLVDTPHQEYITVDAYANLPATGSKDTIYRVSNYNGSTSQVDASVYSEYAWDGTQYIFLCVKSQISEVFDISVYNNNTKYADLAAALNGGANIPQSLQKGGMSVKFVQSSDNKYIQARCMAQNFTTDVTQWQGIDPYPIKDSHNLLESDGAFQIKDEANFTQGFVGTTYTFEQIKVNTIGGTYGRKRVYFPRIGYKETFKFTVIASDGASLADNSISLYVVASNDSTYLFKSDLSLNEEFEYTTTSVGYLGFAIQVSASDVVSDGFLTLKIEKATRGTVFDELNLRLSYYLNFASQKIPTITQSTNGTYTVNMQATTMGLKSYDKVGGVSYSHTFNEAVSFEVAHNNALYWFVEEDTVSVETVSSTNSSRPDVVCLLANSNGTAYGLLYNQYIYNRNSELNSLINEIKTGLVNKDGGIYNISEANLTNDNPTEYETLKDALGTNGSNVPSEKRYSGMNIKFIQATLADYNVVKVTGLSEAPSGATLLASASTVGNGVFKASQLSDFATLPASIGNVAVYYIAVTETVDEQEVTTYTSWTITKISNDATKYVQCRYIATSTANTDFVTLTNWQGVDDGITPNSVDLVKGKDVFNLLDSKNLNIGDVTGEYRFEGIFASKTYGVNYVKKLLGQIGVAPYERIILKVVPADVNGATIKDGTIDLRTIAQTGSTYSFANVSLNQEYEYFASGAGLKGFCVYIARTNVLTEGYITLICKRVIGSLYDYISRSSIVLARFQGEKVPSIVRTTNLRFSITFQATTANLYCATNMERYSFTLAEETTFNVNSYEGVYLNTYDGTLFKATIGATNTQSKAAILLFGVYNNTPFGVLANYYFSERARTFESDISAINNELSDLTDGIPSYFVDNVNQAIAKIKTNMAAVGRNGESFIFISDMHWDTNVKNSHKLVRKILNSTNLIDVLSTGDLINESKDKSVMATALIDCVKAFSFNGHPLITTRGNHDDNSNWASQEDKDAYSFTFNEYYSYFMKQMEGLVTFIGTDDSFYYDKPETKTRYIFIDSGRSGTVGGNTGAIQNSVNLLNDTETGWKVVFIQHFPTGAGMNAIKAMVDGCNDRSNAKVIPSYSITADFSNAQCECVAIFAGHTHADGSSTTDGGVPIIIIDTDCLGRKTASEQAEWRGTYNEQCFDVVTMDYINKTIKCVRVGRGSDRTFTY